jgi:hypothetical protein
MAVIYLNFNNHARLHAWLNVHRQMCEKVTGVNPVSCIAKPIAPIDMKTLPFTHASFPEQVQWWVNKYCPYPYAKKPARAKLKTKILNWYYYKFKKR